MTSEMRAQRADAQHDHGVAHRQALTDPLTGLGNRRRLLEDLDGALESAQPERPVLLALFDLDGFKAYNDTYGHPAGDALLQRLGAALVSALDSAGTAYRLGGDEFCVLADVDPAVRSSLVARCVAALTEGGEGFEVRPSH